LPGNLAYNPAILHERALRMAKMTMKQFEKSAMDRKADKTGKHGKEGSAKDKAADAKTLKAINKRKK
jgi:hypothetical protein